MPNNNIVDDNVAGNNDLDEVKNAVASIMCEPLLNDDRGAALIGLVEAYSKVMTRVNGMYIDNLKSAIRCLKDVRNSEMGVVDEIEKSKVRDRLNK